MHVNSEFVVGLDIGYSNVKLVSGVAGHDRAARHEIYPAGAGPAEKVAAGLDRAHGIEVDYAGQRWSTLIDPQRLEDWPRTLHRDYPSTKTYQALFRAGLSMLDRDKVDTLVTGLPVNQYLASGAADKLKAAMTGPIEVRRGEFVRVVRVDVIPQPLGAFLAFAEHQPDPDVLEASRVLVIDPGFFSFDWVIVERGGLRRASSGTSTHASSYLLEKTAEALAKRTGGKVSRERLEESLREGKRYLHLFGERVEFGGILRAAAEEAANVAFRELQSAVRQEAEKADFDFVVLAGGGSAFYESAARHVFPRAKVERATDSPVLANAEGFWLWGHPND